MSNLDLEIGKVEPMSKIKSAGYFKQLRFVDAREQIQQDWIPCLSSSVEHMPGRARDSVE